MRRPGSVVSAAVITWISSGLALAGSLISLLSILVARDQIVTEIESVPQLKSQFDTTGLDAGSVVSMAGVVVAVLAVWCLSAVLLAVFAFRGANWARILLAVSGGVAAMLSLLYVALMLSAGSAMVLFPFLYLAATTSALVLLFRPEANAYFRAEQKGQKSPVW